MQIEFLRKRFLKNGQTNLTISLSPLLFPLLPFRKATRALVVQSLDTGSAFPYFQFQIAEWNEFAISMTHSKVQNQRINL